MFELGLHVRDVVAITGNATMMGEWYHASIEARSFPTNDRWRPYLAAGIGSLNEQDLFEDFVAIGVGVEHRSSSERWAFFAELAVDQPYSARRDGMAVARKPSPYGALGVRFYY